MPKKKDKAVVVVKDGYAQCVYANVPTLNIEIIDRDKLEEEGLTSEDSAMQVAHATREMERVYSA